MSGYRVTFYTPVGTQGSVFITADYDEAWRRVRDADRNGVRATVEEWLGVGEWRPLEPRPASEFAAAVNEELEHRYQAQMALGDIIAEAGSGFYGDDGMRREMEARAGIADLDVEIAALGLLLKLRHPKPAEPVAEPVDPDEIPF